MGQRPTEAETSTSNALKHGAVINDPYSATEKLRNPELLNERFLNKIGARKGFSGHAYSHALREHHE